MMRAAWIMRLKPGCEADYKEKHENIGPEMLELMKRQGVRNFSIFRDGLTLFAYQEREAPADPAAPHDLVVRRWWRMMAPTMETNPDGSPWQRPIEEVFHAD